MDSLITAAARALAADDALGALNRVALRDDGFRARASRYRDGAAWRPRSSEATDPGWTPLFVHASGVILEVGGLLQHGALVAREYGLPCVAGVEHATELWNGGDLVEVDGSAGIVRKLR